MPGVLVVDVSEYVTNRNISRAETSRNRDDYRSLHLAGGETFSAIPDRAKIFYMPPDW
jgi:hypothetical protein